MISGLDRLIQFLNIDKVLNNELLLEMVKNATAPLISDTTKSETFLTKRRLQEM